MRGKGEWLEKNMTRTRITPAYAGKSFCSAAFSHMISGSPPPMRGKVFLAPLVLSVIRITPAYAGKSK